MATDLTGHKSLRDHEQEIGVYQPMTDTAKPAYRVLARKYRPDTFSELIGQDALVRTLGNALSLGRLAHAFVLTGVRGIGKTSTARLLAKGLNCIGADGFAWLALTTWFKRGVTIPISTHAVQPFSKKASC